MRSYSGVTPFQYRDCFFKILRYDDKDMSSNNGTSDSTIDPSMSVTQPLRPIASSRTPVTSPKRKTIRARRSSGKEGEGRGPNWGEPDSFLLVEAFAWINNKKNKKGND